VIEDPAPISRNEAGWYPIEENGYAWEFHTKQGDVIGGCYCLAITGTTDGQEEWQAIYYKSTTDFNYGDTVFNTLTNNLSECVEWVEMQIFGGYYL
jgi:hypothetical protein